MSRRARADSIQITRRVFYKGLFIRVDVTDGVIDPGGSVTRSEDVIHRGQVLGAVYLRHHKGLGKVGCFAELLKDESKKRRRAHLDVRFKKPTGDGIHPDTQLETGQLLVGQLVQRGGGQLAGLLLGRDSHAVLQFNYD